MKKTEGLYELSVKRLESMTDVPITFETMSKVDGANVLRQQIAAGEFPQVVIGNFFQPADISQFAANGIILPIEEYINEKDTPNIWKLYQERPAIKAASVAPDGHIYTLPGVDEFMPEYLENIIYINKTWLDKVGMEVPSTLVELKEVLKAFKEKDPNGNGKADEIPMTFNTTSSSAYPEVLLSSFGVATKFGTWDSWLTVQNGEVKFTPIIDEWKSMLEYYRDLYAEGLLDMEAFTHDGNQFTAKLQTPVSTVGLVWSNANPMLNADEYIAFPPMSADGKITPVWRIHPGYIGTKDFLVIFKSCQNPQNVLKWADKFYEIDNSIQNAWGEAADNSTISKDGDGFKWNKLPEGKYFASYLYQCVLSGGIPRWLPPEIYNGESGRVPVRPEWEEQTKAFEIYEPYLDKETWPRPYYAVEEADRLSELTTDIFNLTETQRAKWVCGQEDLNDAWNAQLSQKIGEEYAFWNLGIGFGRASDAASDGAWLYKAKQNDIVFVCYGVNDILNGETEEQIKSNLTYIVYALKKIGKKVILQTVPPFDYTGDNIEKWNNVNTYIKTILKDKVDCVFDNVPFLSNEDCLSGAKYGGHPNEEGCALWAEVLFSEVKDFFR